VSHPENHGQSDIFSVEASLTGARISNSRGFSIVEVLVALGILAMVSLGVGTAISALREQQQSVVTADTGDNFSAAFFQHLLIQDNCNAAIVNKQIPSNEAELDLNITTFRGMGEKAANTVRAGAQVDQNLFISRVFLKRKPDVKQAESTRFGEANKDRYIAQVILRLEKRVPGQPVRALPDRIMEIPVLAAENTPRMETCQLESDANDLCLAMGGTMTNEGVCAPPGQCTIAGTFIKTTCDGSPRGYKCAGEYSGSDRSNTITGGEYCPADSCPVLSGKFRIERSVKTGKKSHKIVKVTENFYMCLRCPDETGKTPCTSSGATTAAPASTPKTRTPRLRMFQPGGRR
jgi:prepilin-type N-terminal cleavage/methylation domain-containing protein